MLTSRGGISPGSSPTADGFVCVRWDTPPTCCRAAPARRYVLTCVTLSRYTLGLTGWFYPRVQ
eukprot:4060124-Pyramimonas_sp.AAC.1